MKTMICRNRKVEAQPTAPESEPAEIERRRSRTKIPGIIDHKVTLLAVAGAAVSADCDPCLDRIIPELEGAGITKADIRLAVKSGRFLGAYPDMGANVFDKKCRHSRN